MFNKAALLLMIWNSWTFLQLRVLRVCSGEILSSTRTGNHTSHESYNNYTKKSHIHHLQRRHLLALLELDLLAARHTGKTRFITIANLSAESLIEILDSPQESINELFIFNFTTSPLLDSSTFSVFDDILTPRLWLTIRQMISADSVVLSSITIEKVPSILERKLKIITSKNFATQDICETRPLAATNINGDAWGNRAIITSIHLQQLGKYVTLLACTKRGSKLDESPFNVKGQCEDRINKHECIFLPSTNCTLPPSIFKDLANAPHGMLLYDKASPEATQLRVDKLQEYDSNQFQNKKNFAMDTNGKSSTTGYELNGARNYFLTGVTPEFVDEKSRAISKTSRRARIVQTTYLFGYVHRMRSEFRWQVQQLVDGFRLGSNPPFLSNVSCVMAHIRKDDRHKPNYDMIEWCRNHTYWDLTMKRYVGYDIEGNNKMFDYGCHLVLPYGAASIEHFLNASVILAPTIKNIFIATDEPSWVHHAVIEYRKLSGNLLTTQHLKLFPFHPPSGHRRDSTIDSNAEFFATIMLGQQCEGFVGYESASAAAQLLFDSMCYFSGHQYLSCPRLFDFGHSISPFAH